MKRLAAVLVRASKIDLAGLCIYMYLVLVDESSCLGLLRWLMLEAYVRKNNMCTVIMAIIMDAGKVTTTR